MGKDREEEYLRRVSRERTEVHATSESLNVSDMRLSSQLSQGVQIAGAHITSPIMSRVDSLPYYPNVQGPPEQAIDDANREVGLKLSSVSYKREGKIEEARKRQTQQQAIAIARNRYRAPNPHAPAPQVNGAMVFDLFKAGNIASLMSFNTGKTAYDLLQTQYDSIHELLGYLPAYAAEIAQREQRPNLNATEKEELAKARAKLRTLYDIRAYYEVQERIASNKYYVYVDQDKMLSLSYKELRKRLNELYQQPQNQRNEQLIDYYQNLIRLKELNLKDGASVDAREAEYLEADKKAEQERTQRANPANPQAAAPVAPGPVPDRKVALKELKNIASCYKSFEERFGKRLTIGVPEAYTGRFFETFGPDIKEYLRAYPQRRELPGSVVSFLSQYDTYVSRRQAAGDPPDDATQTILRRHIPKDEEAVDTSKNPLQGVEITKAQKEGIRTVAAYLLQSTEDNQAFTYNVISARPEQQLMIYYLIEQDRLDTGMGIDFHTAVHNYVPDAAAFKKNFKWKNMSRAVRTAMKLDSQLKAFVALSAEIDADEDQIRQDSGAPGAGPAAPGAVPQAPRTDQEKLNTLISALGKRGQRLRMLYRNAGLHEDMPPDMAADPALREQMFDEYRKITGYIQSIQTLAAQAQMQQPAYEDDQRVRRDGDSLRDAPGVSLGKVSDGMEMGSMWGDTVAIEGVKDVFISGGGTFAPVTEAAGYLYPAGIFGAAGSLFAITASIIKTIEIANSSAALTTADKWEKGVALGGEYLEEAGSFLLGAGEIVEAATDSLHKFEGYVGHANNALWHSTNAAGWLGFAGGVAGLVAGSVKMGAASVKVHRARSSLDDVARARTTMKTNQDQRWRDAAGRIQTDRELQIEQRKQADEEKLGRFLDHQQRESERIRDTAGCGIVSGALTGIAGGFMMTGYLAPVGAIVGLVGLAFDVAVWIGDRKRKWNNMKLAVDEFLKLDELVQAVKTDATHPMHQKLSSMSDKELREPIRQEALAMLGFMDYSECFRHVSETFATLIYNKVFIENPPPDDRGMYLDAMMSLGMKIDQNALRPSIEAMTMKLMKA